MNGTRGRETAPAGTAGLQGYAVVLGFVAGFVDAAGFVALAGLFAAHVTGNFVLIGAALVGDAVGLVAKLLALPVFVLAVAGARLLALGLERAGRRPLPWLLAAEALLLAGFGGTGAALAPFAGADSLGALLVGMQAVAAMGVQNALGRLCLPNLAATTVMTVNVTQAVIDAVDLALGRAADAGARARLRRIAPAVLAFACGALAGAFGVAYGAFWCALLPVLLLAGLAAAAARDLTRAAAPPA
ncbi:YoaK family protein [Methylobacterium radiodurans]|uniref:DUF1275 domain-containing protein n=1 Tax=Methylobacterium radiodurans TaxID=2202828 RepID=A0A2U8VVZ8_9HYPH|nr:YoaK family protein [Methylobacterium radiodurans]AWN37490.1 DUF1275 domain-containing protein [Methylobacterium radiodurans]